MSGNRYYRVMFPTEFTEQKLKITHLELWAVILSIKLWGDRVRGLVIRIRTDNKAIATIINTGRSKDLYLQKQLHELTWWLAMFDCKIKGVHLAGQLNRLPDLLSRWNESPAIQKEFSKRTEHVNMIRDKVPMGLFEFTNNW